MFQNTEDETEKSHEVATPGPGTVQTRPRLGVVSPPRTPPRVASSPITLVETRALVFCPKELLHRIWHEPVLKVRHEPVLMKAARLAVGTGTNVYISAGLNTNRH